MRVWVLVTDWEPLTVWAFAETYAKVATSKYDPHSNSDGVHLTNVIINTNLEES